MKFGRILKQVMLILLIFKQTISMNNKFWNAPAWSLGNKYGIKSEKKYQSGHIPGPGTYDLHGAVNKHGCKIGTSTRGINNRQNQPGPGNYNITSKYEGPKVSMANKLSNGGLGANSFTPGPGNYNFEDNHGSGVTMGAKYSSSKVLKEEPGPGSYNIEDNKKSGVKIGTAQRTGMGVNNKVPGPGEYTYDKRPYSAGPKYGFGKAGKGSQYGTYAPGPGQYDVNSFTKNGEHGGRTMGERFKRGGDSTDLGPGPGYYDHDVKRYASGVKIGTAQRGMYNNGTSPGPGAYDSCYKSLHGGTKMGTSKRGQMGTAQTPGPGAYDTLKQSRGGVTISGHRGKSRMDYVPGPGAYNPDDYNKGRPCSAKIGNSLRSEMQNANTPGPGQYYHQDGHEYKFAYTKQLRSKDAKKGDPGPGQYEIPSSVPSAPHYLIDPNIYKSYGGSHGSRT